MKASITEALSCDDMTQAIIAVTAVVLAVLTIGAVGAAHLTPVSDPAWVTVRTLALYGITVVTVLTGGTHLLAVFPKETFRAKLITACAIPASVTGDAATLCHLTRLLAFAVSTPVPAVLSVEPGWTGLSAELASVSWCAGAGAIGRVALAMNTLAVALTAGPPQALTALAAPGELVTGGVVTVTLDRTVTPHPARVTLTAPSHGVADGVDAAVAVVVTLRAPGTRVTGTFTSVLVTLALLTQTGMFTVRTPAVVVAGTLSSQVITLAVGVAMTLPLTVGTPELGRALRITACSKISMSAATFIWPNTYFIFLTGEVSLAERGETFIP